VAITTAAYLERRPATVQAVLPGADALGFEVATLLLGVVTAVFVLGSPWLLPAVFVLVAVLHRSTLVNELEGAARTDTKTGLLNATAWHSLADQHLLRAERQGTPVAVLMIDLDDFKMVNDRCGHLAGDRTLKAVAVCLKEELRGYDAVGRFGGEEFIALLDGVATETATNTAVRITQAIRALTPLTADHGCAQPITASIGVASYPGDGTSIDALTAAAPGMQPRSNTVAQMPIGGRRRWSIFVAYRQVVASVSAISHGSGPALWRVLRHAGPVRIPGKGTR